MVDGAPITKVNHSVYLPVVFLKYNRESEKNHLLDHYRLHCSGHVGQCITNYLSLPNTEMDRN